MELPDLTNLTLVQVFGLGALIALIDVLGAYLLAATHGDFSLSVVAVWLQSHVLKRIFPIFSLAVIGHGIPALDIPPIGPAYIAAIAGLVAYTGETIKSIQESFVDTNPANAKDTSPVPPG